MFIHCVSSRTRWLVLFALVGSVVFSAPSQARDPARFTPIKGFVLSDISDDGTYIAGSSIADDLISINAYRIINVDRIRTQNLYAGSQSEPRRISRDGQAIVGTIGYRTHELRTFYWSGFAREIDGPDYLTLPEDLSRDGTTVVGWRAPAPYGRQKAFRWTAAKGMEELGTLAGDHSSYAIAVSADGRVVTGSSSSASTYDDTEAFRWTKEGGMVGLGVLPGGFVASYAKAISDDGRVIAGKSIIFEPVYITHSFVWSEQTGMVDLGVFPGALETEMKALSADGQVVVGESESESGEEAFRWSASTGLVRLADPSWASDSSAYSVSANGLVVLGKVEESTTTGRRDEPFIWIQGTGPRMLHDILAADGIDVSGWSSFVATRLSRDGLSVIGYGKSPLGIQSWIVRLPGEDVIPNAGVPTPH